ILYVIVGDGDQRTALECLARELGVEGCIEFRGEIDDTAMIECYQQCDLFVLPNRNIDGDIEGFGIVLLEAQACGRPVIAGASGGTAETMRIGETGEIIDCTSPEPLASAIVRLLADPARRQKMGETARRWILEHFDWSILTGEAAEIFG